MRCLKNTAGFALVESLIAIAIFSFVATASAGIYTASVQSSKQSTDYVVAAGLLNEGTEAVRSIRSRDFAELTNGTHGLTTTSGYYELSGSSESLMDSRYTRTITIEDAYRTGSLTGDLASSGVLDTATKEVTVNVTWDTLTGKTQNIDSVIYLHNLDASTSTWVQDLTADWEAGVYNSLAIATSADGELELQNTDASWSMIASAHSLDLASTGDRIDMAFDDGAGVLWVLSTNHAGNELTSVDISDGILTPVEGSGYDVGGATPYALAISDGYAYIATNDNSAEIHIVDLSTLTLEQSINLTGTADARGVAITGTTLIVTRSASGSSDEVEFLDISDPTGTITSLGSANPGLHMRDVVTDGTTAFVLTTSTAQEVHAYSVSTYVQVDTLNLTGSVDAESIALVGSNLYIGTQNGSTDPDFYLVDASTPSALSISNSLDTDSHVYDITINADESLAFLATGDSTGELSTVDLGTFTEGSAGDVSASTTGQSIYHYGAYVYVGTQDNSEDLVVFTPTTSSWSSLTQIATVDKSVNHDAHAVYVDGTYAYMVTESNSSDDELFIYDISTPSSPTLLGTFDVGARVYDIVVRGDYAYLATNSNSREIDIIDVSTKSSPVRYGSVDMAGSSDLYSIDIDQTSGVLYTGRDSSTNDEIGVYSTVSDGTWSSGSIVGTADPSGNTNALAVASEGDYTYLGRSTYVYVYDTSTPSSPSLIGSYNTGGTVYDLVMNGDYVYAATSHNSQEIVAIDVSTKSSPSLADTYNASGNQDMFSLVLNGDYLYAGRDYNSSTSRHELFVMDVSTASTLSYVGSTNSSGDLNDVAISGDYVYASSNYDSGEIHIFDVSTKSSPASPTLVNMSGNDDATELDITGSLLAIGRVSGGSIDEVSLYDISSPTSPSLQDSYDLAARVESIAFESSTSLIVGNDANGSELAIFDVTTPSAMSLTGTVDLNNGDPRAMMFNGSSLYIASEHNSQELQVVQALASGEILTTPSLLASLNAGEDVNDLVLNGTELYAATSSNSSELQVYDVTTPSSISLSGSYNASGSSDAEAVDVYGSTVVLGIASATGLYVIDVTTPSSPSLHGSYTTTTSVYGVDMPSENEVLLATASGSAELQVWDISTPTAASQIATEDLGGSANDVKVYSSVAYIATDDNSNELYIYTSGSSLTDYALEGMFTSQAFDSGSTGTTWQMLEWTESGTGSVEFRIRTADSEANLSSATWVGSDGTSATTYTTSGDTITVDPGASGTQWYQFRAYLSGDGSTTPVVEDVTTTYAQ